MKKITKKEIVPDISSVAFYNKRKQTEKPKLKNVDNLFNTIPKEFKIVGIADCSLYHKIDEKDLYKKEYLNTKLILEAPKGIKADIFILQYAFKNNALILSNDCFSEYNIVPKDWLDSHRIGFMIINEQFFFNKTIETLYEAEEEPKTWNNLKNQIDIQNNLDQENIS